MATANAVPTTAFHVTFIFCIIVLTMIFAHFLIRLCMLTLHKRPQNMSNSKVLSSRRRRRHRHRHRHRTQPDLEEGLVTHDVTHDGGNREPLCYGESDHADQRLPLPPPAYGWWRGSVRVDPEDLRHYDDQSELQQQTRGLVFAGSGQRPPSYTSDPLNIEAERPAPLFQAQRDPARNHVVRDV